MGQAMIRIDIWHARTRRYGEGWARDPTYSQQKRAKPTYADPEDDMKVDPSMPMGSTSKTYNPRADGQLWPSQSGSGEEWTHSSASSSKWRDMRSIIPALLAIPLKLAQRCAILAALMSRNSEGDAVRDWHAKSSYRQ